jgi:pimeloyl-ACP methyl ester carboxylesterase
MWNPMMRDTATALGPRPAQVAEAFLTPRPPRQRQPLTLGSGEALRLATAEGEVALQRAGTGPTVLLLHGWEGQASDLAAFVPPLLEAGLGVLVMDLPAHGDSAGTSTSIPQAARGLRAVGEVLGPLYAAVAHSLGAAVLAEALHAGLEVQRAVLVSAPAHYERHARRFAAAAGLDAEGTDEMLAVLGVTVGVDLREISLPRRAQHLRLPALFIHSADDRVVAIEDSLTSAAAWPGAVHLSVEGLGHRRILVDPAVVAATLQFLTTTG